MRASLWRRPRRKSRQAGREVKCMQINAEGVSQRSTGRGDRSTPTALNTAQGRAHPGSGSPRRPQTPTGFYKCEERDRCRTVGVRGRGAGGVGPRCADVPRPWALLFDRFAVGKTRRTQDDQGKGGYWRRLVAALGGRDVRAPGEAGSADEQLTELRARVASLELDVARSRPANGRDAGGIRRPCRPPRSGRPPAPAKTNWKSCSRSWRGPWPIWPR